MVDPILYDSAVQTITSLADTAATISPYIRGTVWKAASVGMDMIDFLTNPKTLMTAAYVGSILAITNAAQAIDTFRVARGRSSFINCNMSSSSAGQPMEYYLGPNPTQVYKIIDPLLSATGRHVGNLADRLLPGGNKEKTINPQ